MTSEELGRIKLESEAWLARSDEQRAHQGTAMPEAQARLTAFLLLELLALVPLLDELFFNTDGDPGFTKFMAAEQAYRKFRSK